MARLANLFAVILFAAGLTAFAFAQQANEEPVKLPDTPVGRTVSAFIKALNTGELETMKKFHQAHGGNADFADQDMGFYKQSGGLKIHSATRATEYEIELLGQTKNNGDWLSLTITVDQQAPHPIAQIKGQPAQAPAEKAQKPDK